MPTTTVYDRGAVVLLPFPFSDQSSGKIRPAIVANPVYPSDDLLIVTTLLWPITRLRRRKALCSLLHCASSRFASRVRDFRGAVSGSKPRRRHGRLRRT